MPRMVRVRTAQTIEDQKEDEKSTMETSSSNINSTSGRLKAY